MVPKMFTRLSMIALGFVTLSLPLLTKKKDDFSRKSATTILDEAIKKIEEEENLSPYFDSRYL